MRQLLAAVLVLVPMAAVGRAQSRGDCSMSSPPGIGLSMGRSSPYLYLARGAVDAEETGSILVRGGIHLAGRVDVPIGGPWRTRAEGSFANWRVVRQIYGDGFELAAVERVGHVAARQFVALIGRQGGRSPLCGYVLAGGGIYSLGYRGARVRRPGVAMTAGVELPVGDRGAIQADVQLHVIDIGKRYPLTGTEALAASISVGWSHRF